MLLVSLSAYLPALLGGMLIGLAAVILWWSIAKVAGVSGIVASLLQPRSPNFSWQLAFFVGLLVSPWVLMPFLDLRAAETGGLRLKNRPPWPTFVGR